MTDQELGGSLNSNMLIIELIKSTRLEFWTGLGMIFLWDELWTIQKWLFGLSFYPSHFWPEKPAFFWPELASFRLKILARPDQWTIFRRDLTRPTITSRGTLKLLLSTPLLVLLFYYSLILHATNFKSMPLRYLAEHIIRLR